MTVQGTLQVVLLYLNVQQLECTQQVVNAEPACFVCVQQSKAILKLLLLLFAQEACKQIWQAVMFRVLHILYAAGLATHPVGQHVLFAAAMSW